MTEMLFALFFSLFLIPRMMQANIMAQYPQVHQPQPGFIVPPPQPVIATELGDTPRRMVCPNCRNEVLTSIESECSIVQHIACFVMCITGVCTICSCLPYCMSSLGTVRHECPNCHAHLGSYSRWK